MSAYCHDNCPVKEMCKLIRYMSLPSEVQNVNGELTRNGKNVDLELKISLKIVIYLTKYLKENNDELIIYPNNILCRIGR